MALIEWKEPWHAAPLIEGIPFAQRQFEREITRFHPLYGRGGKVVGCRQDCDDVVVVLDDGSYVNVHLVWNQGSEPYPDKYPSWFSYGILESFIVAMNADAAEFSE